MAGGAISSRAIASSGPRSIGAYTPPMELRTLRRSEREPLLDLLDQWQMPDGWQGRDFFRRYLEDDPTFSDENVWVAVDAGRLVSCVQVFPRPLQICGKAVPAGGIGSVFTLPDHRLNGTASPQEFRNRPCNAAPRTADEDLHILHAVAPISAIDKGHLRPLVG